jgi:hypothetical protein
MSVRSMAWSARRRHAPRNRRRSVAALARVRAAVAGGTARGGWRRLLGSRGRLDDAVAVASDATRLFPADASAWEQLASLHADRGDAARLAPVVTVLRRDFPQRAASWWYFAASERFLAGDVAGAMPLVQRAIALDAGLRGRPEPAGRRYAETGNVPRREKAFSASLRLDPVTA